MKFQPQDLRFMTRLIVPGCCLNSDNVTRRSYAMFSVPCRFRTFHPSSLYVTSRLQWHVVSMPQ
jgi:hypothetical protein